MNRTMSVSSSFSLAWVIALLAGIAVVPAAFAQVSTGTIQGFVNDPSGAGVSAAPVRATNIATGQSSSTVSAGTGEYRIFAVPVGEYVISVEMSGFKKVAKSGIVIQANANARVDISLEVGTITQEVTVSAQPLQVDTLSAQVAQTVTMKQIQDLPLNGRNTAALVTLLPGIKAFQSVNWWGWTTTFVTSNGSRFQNRGTEWLLDGGIHSTTYVSSGKQLPNPDAVEEFQYAGSQRSAEFGRMGSSTINTVTRSGTNEFHGAAWAFHRNHALNARNFGQTAENPKNIRNQFGYTLGGPVWVPKIYNGRNKTFFFTSYQQFEQRQAAFSFDVRVPTALERAGDFSRSPVLPIDPATGAPFPGGKLPTPDPVSAKLLARIPEGDSNGLWRGGAPNPYTQREFLGKGDHYFRPDHRVSFTYFRFVDEYTNQQGSTLPVEGLTEYAATSIQTHYNANYTWTLSPTKLNVFRAVYGRTTSDRGNTSTDTLGSLGARFADNSWQSPIKVIVDGYFSLNATNAGRVITDNRQFSDTFRWVKGRHNLSFGGEVINYLDKEYLPGETWSRFLSDYTGNALANFYLGVTSRFESGVVIPPPPTRHWLFAAFFQDDWKATRRLSLNLGIRFENLTMPVTPNDYGTTFVPYAQSTVFPSAPPGLLFANPYTGQKDAGWRRGGWLNHPKRFTPRFGFAYDVFGTGKTAIRGGFGIYESEIHSISMRNNANPLNPPGPTPVPPFVRLSDPWNYPGGFDPVERAKTWAPGPGDQPVFPRPWSVGGFDPNWTRPYTMDFSLGFQQQLPQATMLEMSYVGNLGRKLWYNYELYPAQWRPGATNDPQDQACRTAYLPCQVRPIFVNGTPGTMNYHGLHTYVNRRFNKGLLFSVSYTFAKGLDTNQWPVQNFAHMNMEHGRTDDDRTHVMVTNFVYQPGYLRFSNRFVNFLLGGWEISGILNTQSGAPITIYSGTNPFANDYFGGRPVLVGEPRLNPNRSRSEVMNAWFTKAAFVAPQPGQFGMGRNVLEGPGMKNIDTSLTKIFRVTERYRFQYRWEMFNAANWVNLSPPRNSMTDPQFGRITGAGSMRQMQMSLKFQF